MSEMMELQPQELNQEQPQNMDQPQNQNQDLQQRNDLFTIEQASEILIEKNDVAVEEESEYPPEAVDEWQDHKINNEYEPTDEFVKEGGSDHEQITQ